MGEIRITSGRYRGRVLRTPEGETTRPLLTRLRKSLADILRHKLDGMRIIELFGGSGAISFELISNGALSATVIELDQNAAGIIRSNASKLGAPVKVLEGDSLVLLKTLPGPFEIAVVAPPYGLGLQKRAMEVLAASGKLKKGGMAIVQREDSEPRWEGRGFVLDSTREYGRTVFDFYLYEGGR